MNQFKQFFMHDLGRLLHLVNVVNHCWPDSHLIAYGSLLEENANIEHTPKMSIASFNPA
jgi:hypothetical protein